ncbi:Lrp/AsnC family transcriptional regulator [Candidatus Woesearchaeota archaeon]|nr:Lrp/AsnC family transcriptional regulator [Candidatus Woesearchaeota archaeon]
MARVKKGKKMVALAASSYPASGEKGGDSFLRNTSLRDASFPNTSFSNTSFPNTPKIKIDVKDRKILSTLDMDSRMPITVLAKEVGLSRQVVEYRLKRLKKEKVIFGSRAIFDSVVVGYTWYRVIFQLLSITQEEKKKLMDYLRNHPFTFWLGEVGGNWDFVVNFVCKDNFHFNSVFEEVITAYGQYIRNYEVLIYVHVTDLERDYLFPKKSGLREVFVHAMTFNPDVQIDDLDKKIISELSRDADITNVDLANKYDVSANTIKNRINEMYKNKLLLGFRLFINPSVLGYSSHLLFLGVNRLDLEKEKELFSYLKSIPHVAFIVKHIGKWRVAAEVETKDSQEFQDIFVEIRSKFADIITDFEALPLFKDHFIDYFPEGLLK